MQKIGSQTVKFDNKISVLEAASIVGPKESNGPMAKYFDKCLDDEFFRRKVMGKSWKQNDKRSCKLRVNKVKSFYR